MPTAWALGLFAFWLGVIPLLVRRGWPLGTVILGAAVGLALGLGRGLGGLWQDAATVSTDPNLLELIAVVVLIYHFSSLLKSTHRMEVVAEVLQRTMRDPRLVLAAVPALVGLIPMPGGAMFTAPITDEVGNRLALRPEDKVFSNYWFRHCWELAFPLYPGIILCAGVVRLPPLTLAGHLMPLAITAFFAGGLVFWWRSPRLVRQAALTNAPIADPLADSSGPVTPVDSKSRPAPTDHDQRASALPAPDVSDRPGLLVLWPILLVIGVALAKLPLVPGLIAVIAVYSLAERVGWRQSLRHFRDSFNGPILVLVWAVFLFGQVLVSTGLLRLLADHLLALGLPVAVLSCVLPFLMGLLTGVTPGFVGTVFPFLIPFWEGDPVGWLQFAYASGLAGIFLSPAHLCLSMTQEYFRASLRRVLWLVAIPAGAVVGHATLRLLLSVGAHG